MYVRISRIRFDPDKYDQVLEILQPMQPLGVDLDAPEVYEIVEQS